MKQLLSVACNIKISKALFPEDIDGKIQDLPNKLPTLIHALSSLSPYINRLICTEIDWLVGVIDNEIEDVLNQIVANCKKNLKNDTFSKLRIAKRRTNLVILLADFGNVFNLDEVTNSLSTFAEKILELVMDLYVFNEFDRMNYISLFKNKNDYPNEICYASLKSGLCVLGMGKLGSFELNYSSDIDLIFLFDEEKYKPEFYSKIRNVFIVIIRKIVKALSEVTAEGFVFRVDLRLRPDPSSNPICIGALVAQRYYENFGRNWERAIFIKARVIAGDKSFGSKFLGSLTSFVWRKNLDFAAIEDINNIRKKIRKKTPRVLNTNLLGYNIKTGLGGIREIEFFAQTQQLIRGGKNKSLRENATVNVLKQLKKTDLIIGSVEKKLIQSYEQLRFLEHILQLMEDSQTHEIPNSYDKVQDVAVLFGITRTEDFLQHIYRLLNDVNSIITELYARFDPVDKKLFLNVSHSHNDKFFISYIEKWQNYRALRSERASKLFDELSPQINLRILQTENVSNTLFHFDNFIKSLSFGIQVLSLFKANPAVLDLLIDICGAAPALAEYLGKNSSVLDVVTDQSFFLPLSTRDELFEELSSKLSETIDYENILDCARVFVKENQFRAGVHLLKAFSSISSVSRSFSNIAEVCLVILFEKVHAKFSERYGTISGLGPCLLAMGKLGSKEMSIGSDLDLILIYHAERNSVSTGKKSVAAQVYYSRLTQAFISAVTVATTEGFLFKVDMRLRPSGNKGTVATSISSFENYQVSKAWVWERLALSRGRILNGEKLLRNKLTGIIKKALNSKIIRNKIIKEVQEMRLRIEEKAQKNSPRDELKLGPGRLQDLELLIQMGALLKKSFNSRSPKKMISSLTELDFFTEDEAIICEKAYSSYSNLQQILNITSTGQIGEESITNIKNILKSHNYSEFSENIKEDLSYFSNSIDSIFQMKLTYD